MLLNNGRMQGAMEETKSGSYVVMKFGEAASMQLVFSPSKLLNFPTSLFARHAPPVNRFKE